MLNFSCVCVWLGPPPEAVTPSPEPAATPPPEAAAARRRHCLKVFVFGMGF